MIDESYLKGVIKDAKKKKGTQHAINKEILIQIIEEVLRWRNLKST